MFVVVSIDIASPLGVTGSGKDGRIVDGQKGELCVQCRSTSGGLRTYNLAHTVSANIKQMQVSQLQHL